MTNVSISRNTFARNAIVPPTGLPASVISTPERLYQPKPAEIAKPSFAVIGIEGSTDDGEGFIPMLWSDANAHFDEVSPVASRDENGALLGIWGAMSDETRSFLPWTDGFSRGLYLAGVECPIDAEVPDGWTKRVVPGYEYLAIENRRADTFSRMVDYFRENGVKLVGAVQEFTDPKTQQEYLYFPIRAL